MKRAKRMVAWLLTAALCACVFSACGDEKKAPQDMRLTVGYTAFNGAFSPFYAELPGDCDVVDMTQLKLLSTDRRGRVIMNGIHGEATTYNGVEYVYYGPADVMMITGEDGTVDYEFTLREDLVFSDGKPLTADDVIFSMYTLCDPMYDGPSDFASLPIRGLAEYRAGMTEKWKLILRDTPKNASNGSAEGYYTAEEALSFWAAFNDAGTQFAQSIVDYYIGMEQAEDVCGAAALIGYTGLPKSAEAVDLFNAIVDRQGYDVQAIESAQVTMSFEELLKKTTSALLKVGVVTGESASTITGITKTGTYSLRVSLTANDTAALPLFCINIAPLHYYGDPLLYKPQEGLFGFPKGDLTLAKRRGVKPRGAGPYCFMSYEENVVTFAKNVNYYLGEPKTKWIEFAETDESEKISALQEGDHDMTVLTLSRVAVSSVAQVNGGVLNGDVLSVINEENGGYSYIGISANGVKVGDDPGSDSSKYLRRALATMLAYYRQSSLEEYYGTNATLIEYPMTPSSAMVPTMQDAWYTSAFSTDIHGKEIELDMQAAPEKKAETVLQVALTYLQAAGYTVRNGKVVAAPEGASLFYELWFPSSGSEKNAAYAALVNTRNAFEKIGITLNLREQRTDGNVRNAVILEQAKVWCAENGATSLPELYAFYYSGNATAAGAQTYKADVDDERLNQLLLRARYEQNEEERRLIYAECFAMLEEWGVVVPLCETKRAMVYRKQSVDGATLAKDTTGCYSWIREVEKISMIQ